MKYADVWPTYAKEWDTMIPRPTAVSGFQSEAMYAIKNKAQYFAIENATNLPWYMIAVIHRREADGNFNCYLGNGQPLSRVTTEVPKGRGPFSTFLAGAIDAVQQEGWGSVIDWRLEKILYYCELFNGAGYYLHGIPSPYIWGLTNIQKPGKYVSDGRFNPAVMDTQPGCAPLLQAIAKLDPTVTFTRETTS